MTDTLTESFCERCGTRYSFDQTAKPRRGGIGRVRVLTRGLRNYVVNDGLPMADAMAEARDEESRAGTVRQLDAFHSAFNFCISCRQYTCANCWNATAGECLTCAPDLAREILPAPFPDLPAAGPVASGNGHSIPEAIVWPVVDLERGQPGAMPADEAKAPATQASLAAPEPEDAQSSVAEPSAEEPAVLARLDAFVAAPTRGGVEELTAEELAEIESALAATYPVPETPSATDGQEAREVALEPEAAAEAQVALEPEAAAEAQVALEPEAAAEAQVALEPEAAAEAQVALEPEAAAEAQVALEPEAAAEAQVALEPEAAAEAQVALEPEAAAEAQVALEPEAAAEAQVVALPDMPDVTRAPGAPAEPAELSATELPAVAATPVDPVEAGRSQTRSLLGRFRPGRPAAPRPEDEPAAAALAMAAAAQAEPAPEPGPAAPVAEPAPVAAEPAPVAEPAAAPAPTDSIEQPTWRVVAPDAAPAPAEPTSPTPPSDWPATPAWPTNPSVPRPGSVPRSDTVPGPGAAPWAARLATARPEPTGVWAASSQEVLGSPAGAPQGAPAIQACVSCGLSLSANARFCRRCGTRQA